MIFSFFPKITLKHGYPLYFKKYAKNVFCMAFFPQYIYIFRITDFSLVYKFFFPSKTVRYFYGITYARVLHVAALYCHLSIKELQEEFENSKRCRRGAGVQRNKYN